jgi:hypothetical protein
MRYMYSDRGQGAASQRSRLRTLKVHAQRHGWLSALLLLILQPLENSKILRIGYVFVTSTAPVSPEPKVDVDQLTARLLDEKEIRQRASRNEDWFFREAVERSLQRGERCFGAYIGDQLATSIWYTEKPLMQLGAVLVMPPGMVFSHRRFTKPEWRGRKIAVWAGWHGRAALHATGTLWTCGVIYATNASSMASSRKGGGQIVGRILQFGPDRWRLSFLSRMDPRCPVIRVTGS